MSEDEGKKNRYDNLDDLEKFVKRFPQSTDETIVMMRVALAIEHLALSVEGSVNGISAVIRACFLK